MTPQAERLVWDLPLRVFHWLLVVSVLASWTTGKIGTDVRQYHMWLGFWMLGLLAFRLIWGIVGTRHSRFASFAPAPGRVMRYARGVLRGTEPETVGHNPLGSLMVFVMLALLAAQAVSGLFIDDDAFYAGPYAGTVSKQTAEVLESLHHNVPNWIAVLAVLHVAAVLFHTFRLKERIVPAMISGKKAAAVVPESEAIRSPATVRGLIVAAIAAGLICWLVF